jgi:hypothetical protein
LVNGKADQSWILQQVSGVKDCVSNFWSYVVKGLGNGFLASKRGRALSVDGRQTAVVHCSQRWRWVCDRNQCDVKAGLVRAGASWYFHLAAPANSSHLLARRGGGGAMGV